MLMSLTYQETKAQYKALQQTFDYFQSNRESILSFIRAHSFISAAFVGCGSSYCLSESAALSFRLRAGLPTVALAGGDLMLHADRYAGLFKEGLMIAPSRSGSTSEVVEAVRQLRGRQHVPVLSIACVADSPLSQEADLALELPWAFDASVCQTRTVTNLYTANLLLAAYFANDEALIEDIRVAIEQGEAYMQRVEEDIRKATAFDWTNAVVLADGELQGIATEGAIALTEIANVHAHSYHVLDVRHGPMVVVGPGTLVIAALAGDPAGHEERLLHDLKSRGARVIAFSDRPEAIPEAHADCAIAFGSQLDSAAQGIPFIFIPQIAALVGAERRGIHPDQPDGLSAWVKL